MRSLLRTFAIIVVLLIAAGALAAEETTMRVGPTIDVEDAIPGQLVSGAGTIRIANLVGGGAMLAAGRIDVAGTIQGDVLAAAGAFVLAPQAQIGGDLRLAAGDATISGAVGGDVVAATGSVVIDGHVGGDVRAMSGKVVVLPGAVIGGTISSRGPGSLEVSPDAQVFGGTAPEPMPPKREMRPTHTAMSTVLLFTFFHLATVGLFTLGIGLLFLALFPSFAEAAATTLRANTGATLLAGFIVAIAVPFAVAVLFVTILGFPFAILALIAYVLLLALGYGMGALTFAAAIWRRLRVGGNALALPSGFWARALCLFLGLLLIGFLRQVPLVGAMVMLATVLLGLGALSMETWRRWRA
ncbi:MAG TPA: polymer-forming cytoskeletal protein [Alphaproteobacteria bacterium]|nr:polymer-forming cytoskeletal protein [Alphaproteobacteria bacterium]